MKNFLPIGTLTYIRNETTPIPSKLNNMKTKIQIKSIFGKLLFEFEKEDNTIKDTVVEAVKTRAYLQRADLQRASLQGADLRGASLQGADLRGADLQRASLQGASLQRADLQGADLRGASLQGASLQGASLQGASLQRASLQRADLQGADLQRASLQRADLQRASLQGASLQRADLQGADLRGADLQGASLQGADLRGAYLQGADLQGAKGKELSDLKKFFWIVPEEGSFIAWKKCQNAIVKLEIPSEAKRTSNLLNRKCRAEFANVLGIWDMEGNELKEANGLHVPDFIYKVGEIAKPDSYDDDYTNDCSNGIHFFVTKHEAEEWS